MSALGMFGGTLALKGALDEVYKESPHCQSGCIFCDDMAFLKFEWWLANQYSIRRVSPRS